MLKWLKNKLCGTDIQARDELIVEQQKTLQRLVVYLGALILQKHGHKVKLDAKFLEMMINNENLVIDDEVLPGNCIEIQVKDLNGEFNE